jgi:hypothetical protein
MVARPDYGLPVAVPAVANRLQPATVVAPIPLLPTLAWPVLDFCAYLHMI